MDVRDLQLLDWLIWDDVTPCQVTAIGCDYIETTKCGITLAESHLLNFIPLTPEILEKNGFIGDKNVCKTKVRDDSKDELWQCEYAWYLKNLRIKNRTNGSVARLYNIMFVHELQHAMRLCGINKEIKV